MTAEPRQIRALVIDDSAYNRVTLSRMLESDPRIKVAGTAIHGEDGIKQVMKHRPDVITLDLEMPVMDGFAFLRWLMANVPTAVIAISSRSSDRSVFKALELGALDFIPKPGGRVSPRLEEIQRDLVAKVLQVADLRMDNLRRRIREEEPQVSAPSSPPAITCAKGIELVAVGCSTGGPPALQHLFQALPLLPVPFVVAQHMPPTFTRLFADRLNKLSPYLVKEAEDGELLANGSVYISPGGMQTEVRRIGDALQIRIFPPGLSDLYAPSVDRLLKTASDACGDHLVAVIMTGMGDDGSTSIRLVKERGGKTIAESAESAIIFGMPGAAARTGAIDEVASLQEIPHVIRRLCTG